MKYLTSIYLMVVLLYSIVLTSCSSMPSDILPYMQKTGVYTLTKYAHPTSEIDSYNCKVSGNKVFVDVLYTNALTIKLKLTFSGGYFTDIIVVEDTDTFPPFLATGLIKSIGIGILADAESDDFISKFERKIGKKINDLSGAELTLLVLNWDYSIF